MSCDSFIEVDGPSSVSSGDSASLSYEKYVCDTLWKIENFSSKVTANSSACFSPIFAPLDKPDYRWFIGIRTAGETDEYVDFFVKPDFLRFAPENHSYFSYTISVKTADVFTIANWKVESSLLSERDSTLHRLELSLLQKILENDELLLHANITLELLPEGGFSRCVPMGLSKLLGELSSMLGNDSFSDVVISVDDAGTHYTIPAHQVLLAARSPSFLAKLTEDTPERRDRCIQITDLDIMTVRNMLAYIYTDRFDNSLDTKQVIQLLKCSDKYSIAGLKVLSELHLIRRVNDANVFDCLAAADLYSAKELKTKCLQIICQNKRNVGRIKEAMTTSFSELTQEGKLTLLTEIVIEISTRFLPI